MHTTASSVYCASKHRFVALLSRQSMRETIEIDPWLVGAGASLHSSGHKCLAPPLGSTHSRAELCSRVQALLHLQVAAGGFHGAAVTRDGVVFTWGMGRQGALGHGGTSNCLTPTRVNKLAGVAISQVSPCSLS